MPIDMNYYRSIQGAMGLTNSKDVVAEEAKARLKRDFLASVSCEYDSKRNGVAQKFIVTPTDKPSKMDIIAFPDEDLFIGDMIECYGQQWIVTDKEANNTFQWKGRIQQCNLKLRFQYGTNSTIYEQWAYYNKGVYSTNVTETTTAQTGHLQRMLQIQLNEHTRYLHRDKRIATNKIPFPDGHDELQCYKITSYDTVADSYGGGSLLNLAIEEDQFSPDNDNVTELICDYIAPPPAPDPDEPEEPSEDEPGTGGGWL